MKLSFNTCVLIILLFFSCKKNSSNRFKSNYDVVLGAKEDSINKLKGDVLTVFFETGFNKDFLSVKFNGEKREYLITTDMSMGYADYIELGKLSKFESIEFSINNGKNVKLENLKSNLILVNYIKDSTLYVDFTNKFVTYH